MFRRAVLPSPAARLVRAVAAPAAATGSAALATTASSITAFRMQQTDNTNNANSGVSSKEAEAEREARMRQEMLTKMMSNGNPLAKMFASMKPQAAATATATGGAGAAASGTTEQLQGHWADTPRHKMGRLLCSALVFACAVFMMRRLGLTGDYSRLTLPYFAASGADQTKWVLFMFNVDDSRRRALVRQWEQSKAQLVAQHGMSFFDFVDQQEPYWRSSPTHSADAVVRTVSQMMVTNGPPRAITNLKAMLAGSSITGLMFGSGLATPEARAQRIDSMMAASPVFTAFGGAPSGIHIGVLPVAGGVAPATAAAAAAAAPAAYSPQSAYELAQLQYQQQLLAYQQAMQLRQQQQQQFAYPPQEHTAYPTTATSQPSQAIGGSTAPTTTTQASHEVHGSNPFAHAK